MTDTGKWSFWIDRGGTFTDVIAITPDGALQTEKLLSVNPARYDDAALFAVRKFLALGNDAPIPHRRVNEIKIGTTVATNALLERKGAPVALFATQGLKDHFFIGYQNRPDLFALRIERPAPLYTSAYDIAERVDADGAVVRALDEQAARSAFDAALEAGARSAAICFMNAYRNGDHELLCAELARAAGFEHVFTSGETSPHMKYVSRGWTTLLDAYLTPVLQDYVRRLIAAFDDGGERIVRFMRSDGGLSDATHFTGKDAILSGPAGGVVGMAETARAAGFDKTIGFDMGGTSTDVSRFDGAYERDLDTEIEGWRVQIPMMRVHTVASGGGSILKFDQGRAQVGPDSAGADPGPACYGKGGPLTLTDANVFLGKIQPAYFPKVFGPNADQPLDGRAPAQKFESLAQRMNAQAETAAEGFIDIAVEQMAQAVKTISVARGYDVADYALNAFGGAGAQFACRVADALGVTQIVLTPLAGLLSAYGIGVAALRAVEEAALERPIRGFSQQDLSDAFEMLERAAVDTLREQNAEPASVTTRRLARLRYDGSQAAIDIDAGPITEMETAFEVAHKRQFGYVDSGRAVLIAALAVEAQGGGRQPPDMQGPHNENKAGSPSERTRFFTGGAWREADIFEYARLGDDASVDGPAMIVEPFSTIIVEPDWRAQRKASGEIILSRMKKTRAAVSAEAALAKPDPIRLEIFSKMFMSVAEQMGAALERTAASVNIKERLDFSCAVFDAAGALISNAPHMPVHLGSMGAAVKNLIDRRGADIGAGDMFATNDPYNGGTHLPDVTVIAPLFLNDQDAPSFFVAARGHHADIGGATPGSMPAVSETIDEEGVVIDNLRLVENGVFQEEIVRNALAAGRWPARAPDRNIADLKAQIAACQKGLTELSRICNAYGLTIVDAYMRHVMNNAEESVKHALGHLADARFEASLDTGERISVSLAIDNEEKTAIVDFAGAAPQSKSNFNAPSAVTRAAVLYVFRCLTGVDIPLNDGCLRPIEIRIPEGSLLNPAPPAAVAAGNVETSQIIVDALFAAAGALAASQGTMNNLTFGDDDHQYYETICGGAGAGPTFDGASAVHTHMTNSRLTDPEVLELRFPVRLERFERRAGSGGDGAFKGGDGVVREIRFLEPLSLSLLSGRRRGAPFGLNGGGDGAPGHAELVRADGQRYALEGCDACEAAAGDRLILKTPGGGGFGAKN